MLIAAPLVTSAGFLLALEYSATTQRLSNAVTDYIFAAVWATAILMSITFWPVPRHHKPILIVLWIARIGVTLGMMLFYEGYYGLDSAYYFSEGVRESDPLSLFEFGQGTENMIALVGLHNQLLPASFHATKVTCSLLGLVAVYLFYRATCLYTGKESAPLFYLLGLFPSIMFWGSVLGKDPITLFGIAIFVFSIVAFAIKGGMRFIVFAAVGIVIAASIRIWLAAIFIVPLGVVLLFVRMPPWARIVLFLAVLMGGALAIDRFMERFSIETTEDLLIAADIFSQAAPGGGSAQIVEGFTDWGSVLSFLPWAAFTTLFRPVPGEILNPFGLLASAENAFLLWLLYRSIVARDLKRLREPLIAWAVVTIILWAAVYGIFAYQNLGTAFRYKLQVMPMLVVLLLYLGQRHRRGPSNSVRAQPVRKPT